MKNKNAQKLAKLSWEARKKKYGAKGAMEFLNSKNPKHKKAKKNATYLSP